ncbi:hypothetical protein HGRIS_004650 [Hohenbuehelia grisea]|uniref:Uncharacterized protein n=1 Tax=Hohenbuehelia grisea TaxID=104357 RepID=A0ABR3JDB0_9AGAR
MLPIHIDHFMMSFRPAPYNHRELLCSRPLCSVLLSHQYNLLRVDLGGPDTRSSQRFLALSQASLFGVPDIQFDFLVDGVARAPVSVPLNLADRDGDSPTLRLDVATGLRHARARSRHIIVSRFCSRFQDFPLHRSHQDVAKRKERISRVRSRHSSISRSPFELSTNAATEPSHSKPPSKVHPKSPACLPA